MITAFSSSCAVARALPSPRPLLPAAALPQLESGSPAIAPHFKASHSEELSPPSLPSSFAQINDWNCRGKGRRPGWSQGVVFGSPPGPPPPPPASLLAAPGLTAFYFISHCLLAAAERDASSRRLPGEGEAGGRAETQPS